jgi:hypothetical protein
MLTAIEAAERDPARAAEALVSAANARGGEDNITVVLFELVASGGTGETDGDGAAVSEDTEPSIGPVPASRIEPGVDTEEPVSPPVDASRHGAGPGGRIAALLLLAALLAIGIFALYTGVTR